MNNPTTSKGSVEPEKTKADQTGVSFCPACEILAVGTELLLGDVVNTNAAWLSKAMAEQGMDVYWHATVGDNPKRLSNAMLQAASRSHVIVMTGGLGPTDDDLTVATLADTFKGRLISDAESEKQIRDFYITRDTPMNKQSMKQALRPDDGIALPNRVGTAPGLLWDITARVATLVEQGQMTLEKTDATTFVVAMPGVPREMKPMWLEEAVPMLLKQLPGFSSTGSDSPCRLYTRFLKFFGIGESVIATELKDVLASTNPTVSPYVGLSEVKLRLATKAASLEAAEAAFAPLEAQIMQHFGQYYTGKDEDTLEGSVGRLLLEQGRTIAVAESCTGGLVSARLTDISGSSGYVKLNLVTYSNEAKASELGIPADLIEAEGAVSQAVAKAMAEGIRQKTGADLGLSLTGVAGPTGGSADKPVGLVFIGLCAPDLLDATLVKRVVVNAAYGRHDIRHWFSQYALNLARQCLAGQLPQH
ncbi:MAG: competence/damage-inducible protein A [Cyanobacteria bacterium HKST-UBA03]|nr:competence/damage-inducible protein A [Cyanobacteria bacterium HKST-UBA03]